MTDEIIEQAADDVKEVVENAIENSIATATEEEARHAAYQAQLAAEQAQQAAEQVQTQAIIQAANIQQEAAEKIAEHENKTLNLEDEVQWLKIQMTEMQIQMQNLMESFLSTPTILQESQTTEVPTVTPQSNEDAADLAAAEAQQEIGTVAEAVNELLPKRRIKIL